METIKRLGTVIAVLAAILAAVVAPASGQITTACTSSLISSFTPCLNYITGSNNGSGSPTSGCCSAVGSLISSSTECACLILSGNVPLSLPINRTLAISLPRFCNSMHVPLRCKTTDSPLPSPGPGSQISSAPALPPLPPSSPDTPIGSGQTMPPAVPPASDSGTTPQIPDTPSNQGQRPVVVPSSAAKPSGVPAVAPLLLIGTLLLNKF